MSCWLGNDILQRVTVGIAGWELEVQRAVCIDDHGQRSVRRATVGLSHRDGNRGANRRTRKVGDGVGEGIGASESSRWRVTHITAEEPDGAALSSGITGRDADEQESIAI